MEQPSNKADRRDTPSTAATNQKAESTLTGGQHYIEMNEPNLCPDDLRRELFKYYYATQNPERFDLFKKADASEFL